MTAHTVVEDWRDAPLPELVEHLLEEYHLPTRRGLLHMDQLLRRVKTLHGGTHGGWLTAVAENFQHLRNDLEHHLGREEELLFPLLREGQRITDGRVLQGFHADHAQTHALLERLGALLASSDVTGNVPPPIQTVVEGLRNLEMSLVEHMALEDEVLFPRCQGLDA
jgi:regulator of cell morphogenesis and NO signaling